MSSLKAPPQETQGGALRDETKTGACERLDEILPPLFDMLQNAGGRITQVVSAEIQL